MKINKLLVCAVAIVGFGVAGCGGVEGNWKLDKDATKKAMDGEIAKMPADQQEMAKKFADMSDVDIALELKKDGTASMKITAMGKTDEESGTWKKEGDNVTLTNAHGKPMTCTKGGSKLTCTEKHASGDQVTVFVKS
jgi:hypothetical protein